MSSLGPGAEFDLIRAFQEAGPPPGAEVLVGSGDDCAVLEGGWVVGVDAFVEDVHFRRGWIGFAEAGYRAVTAGLSDLAAMAARPVGVLVALGLPDDDAPRIAEGLRSGIRRACERARCALIGGDLTRSPGPVVINVVALGRAHRPALRSRARAGDEVWVTGVLGAAAAAVRDWRCGREPDPSARRAFAAPNARLQEARWLAERIRMTALIDLSDGLVGDAGHIAAASGTAIVLDPGLVPVAPGAVAAAGSRRRALPLALTGGEDYELAFTTPPATADSVEAGFHARFGASLTRVGIVAAGAGVRLEGDGADELDPGSTGFDHFRAPRSDAAGAGRSDNR